MHYFFASFSSFLLSPAFPENTLFQTALCSFLLRSLFVLSSLLGTFIRRSNEADASEKGMGWVERG